MNEIRSSEDGVVDTVDDGRAPSTGVGPAESVDHAREGSTDAVAEGEAVSDFRTAWWQRLLASWSRRVRADDATYELTRLAILRLLAFVYLAAFGSLAFQLEPLLGEKGLLPVGNYLDFLHLRLGSGAYFRVPTLFWLGASDGALHATCWLGVGLSLAVLAGVTNAFVQLALWALYLSFVHVGQIFYGYGWELQLVETGFLAVFLSPTRTFSPLPPSPAPRVVLWLFRWLIFRVMVGAALIKLRGDPCWRDLTCLDFHLETQPNPNPLAWWMHHAPHWAHAAGMLFNHFAELVVPFFLFAPRRLRSIAGVVLVAFQALLISSGNLSFLNWLTIVPALAAFDDRAWLRLLPERWRAALTARLTRRKPSPAQRNTGRALALVVAVLSVGPTLNLLSSKQEMNASFDPLDLVNTYGAFGSVDRARFEVILEGTSDAVPGPTSVWQEYELPCSPGDPDRRPCLISPYHYRLDWQMWFVGNGAARGESVEEEPWLVHLVWQLLRGEETPRGLFARDPFPDAPPRWIRADIWRYAFSEPGSRGPWWRRKRAGTFLRPVSLLHPGLREYVSSYHWPDSAPADSSFPF